MFQYSPILGRSSIWDLKYTFSKKIVSPKRGRPTEKLSLPRYPLICVVMYAVHASIVWGQDALPRWSQWESDAQNTPEKWLHNRIYCPSNRSKQITETHTAYSAGTQYTRQSLNENQHTWLHRKTDSYRLWSQNVVESCGARFFGTPTPYCPVIFCPDPDRTEK